MINRSEILNELFTALSKAQAEMEVSGMTSNNPFFKSKYASYADVVRASRPYLTKHGLSVSQHIVTTDDGVSYLYNYLGHGSGQFIESRVKINPAKSDVQSLGAYVTYMKRYSYAAIVGVVTDDIDVDDMRPDVQEYTISKEQEEALMRELAHNPTRIKSFCNYHKISSLDEMPRDRYDRAIQLLRQKNQDMIPAQ